MQKLLPGILGTVGNTPMVDLSRLVKAYSLEGRILAKLEYLNPGASKKDRIALGIIEAAERDGSLRKGQAVVELTSGNTGTGLAIVCAAKGYRFIAVMSRGNTPERAGMMRALGAEVVLVDQAENTLPGHVSGNDIAAVEERTQEIVNGLGAFRADQFNNAANAAAQERTGEEMWEQCGGRIDAFLDFTGTAGTFMGCAAVLKRHNPDIRCYVVEPEESAYLAGKSDKPSGHRIQGGGYNMELPLLDRSLVTDFLTVSDGEAVEMTRALAKHEGVFAGPSSGANAAAAVKLLRTAEKGSSIAMTVNDSGMKYLSTDIF